MLLGRYFFHHVPKLLWREAVLTAAYLINRLPSRAIGIQIPLGMFSQYYGESVNFCLFPKVFGCASYVHVHKQHYTYVRSSSPKLRLH